MPNPLNVIISLNPHNIVRELVYLVQVFPAIKYLMWKEVVHVDLFIICS